MDIPEMTRLRVLRMEYCKKIEFYEKKIKKFKKLIKKENKAFKPYALILEKEQYKEEMKELMEICEENFIVLMDNSPDLESLRNLGADTIPVNIQVEYQGSHQLDNDHHLIKDSVKLDKNSLDIKNKEYDLIVSNSDEVNNSVVSCAETCLRGVDENTLMNLLEYDYDSLCNGTWTGTIKMWIVGKYEKISDHIIVFKYRPDYC